MRQTTLAVCSLALVATAGVALVSAAQAQTMVSAVPVEYKTDPGEAHPRYMTPVSAAMPVRAITASGARRVMAEEGDTVYALARRHGVSPRSIIDANGLVPPYALQIGQMLILPPSPEEGAAAPGPVAEAEPVERIEGSYRVQPGDTLYNISKRYGVDLRELAAANGLDTPYSLTIDQRLVIPGEARGPRRTIGALAGRGIVDPNDAPILVSKAPGSRFSWPLRGSVIKTFGTVEDGMAHEGINIAAPFGAAIRAAEEGEVIYTGAELEEYGNLLLIRHEGGWISAYGHADTILVETGDQVKQGQVVAKVGRSGDVDAPQLHFELRYNLEAQDPVAALQGEQAAVPLTVGYRAED